MKTQTYLFVCGIVKCWFSRGSCAVFYFSSLPCGMHASTAAGGVVSRRGHLMCAGLWDAVGCKHHVVAAGSSFSGSWEVFPTRSVNSCFIMCVMY